MKSNTKRIAVLTLVLGCLTAGLYHFGSRQLGSAEKSEYVDFINNHPYANRDISPTELSNLPKFDRPDLAAEHNFLQVVDPKLKRIPTERLARAYEYTKGVLKSRPENGIEFNDIQGGEKKNRRLDYQPLSEIEGAARDAIPNVNWSERGPDNVGGRTRALMWDPNDPDATKVWAGSVSGGLWFNNDITDPTSAWIKVDDFLASLAISSIVYDPNNTNTFYVGTGEGFIAGNGGGGVAGAGLYKSTDAGTTWTLLESTLGPDFRYIQKVVATPSNSLLITTRPSLNEGGDGGIFRSTDGGDSWTRVVSGRGADLQLAANGDIYASTGIGNGFGQVWRSTDDGVNWTEVTPPGGNPLWIELAIAPSQSDETSSTRIYALAQSSTARTTVTWFQRSDDGGDTWNDLEVPRYVNQSCSEDTQDFTRGQAFYDLIVAVQPNNPDVVTIGGIDIFRSTEAGENMELVSYWTGSCDDFVHADQHEAAYRPGFPNEAVFGHDGGVSYSSNIGDPNVSNPEFDTRNNNYAVTQFYAVAIRNEVGSGNFLAGSQDNGTQRFSDAGGLTTGQAVGGDGMFCHIDQTDGNFQIASVQFNAVFHSSNGGISFQGLTGQNTSHAFVNPTDLDNDSHILYTAAAGNQYMVIKEINSTTPSAEEFVSVNVGNISHINANAPTENRIYVGSRQGSVFIIDDADTDSPTVTNISENLDESGNVSSVDIGSTEDQLIVTFSNFGVNSVWLTTDGGETWVNKDQEEFGIPDIPVRWALFNPNNSNQVLLATELGVWSTDNILAENPAWEPTSNNLANVRCDMLQYRDSDGVVAVATFGRGVFTTDAFSSTQDTNPPTIVSLSPDDDEIEVLLDQNLVISFNESIVVGTGNITIFDSSDDSVFETIDVTSSAVNISGVVLTVDPTNNFNPSTSYYVNADAGIVTDSNENEFLGISDNTTWNFETFDGDFPPTVAQAIGSIRIIVNETEVVTEDVDLSAVFTDQDNEDSEITYEITSNSNPSLLGTSISGTTLTLSALVPGELGEISLTLTATSNGKTAADNFEVIIGNEVLFDQTSNLTTTSIISMQMTDRADTLVQLSDNFLVASGDVWNLSSITVFGTMSDPAEGLENETITSFNVEIYGDSGNDPDDSNLLRAETVSVEYFPGQTEIRLPVSIEALGSGQYWLSVYSVSPISTARWNWRTRITTDEEWHINDRLGFFGLEAGAWLTAASVGDFAGQDLAFLLEGEILEGTSAPSALSAEINDDKQVALSWTDNSTNETGFIIERSTSDSGPFTEIGIADANLTTFVDTEVLEGDLRYYYRVIAEGPLANSEASATASVLTVPNAPTELALTNQDMGNFSISWVGQSGITSFEVDISVDNFNTFVEGYESLSVDILTILDVEVAESGTYQIRVRALNTSGSSANSAVLEVPVEIALGVEELATFSFDMYPNPSNRMVTIDVPSDVNSELALSITDLSGKSVYSSVVSRGERKVPLDLSNYPVGIYMITLRGNEHYAQARVLKN